MDTFFLMEYEIKKTDKKGGARKQQTINGSSCTFNMSAAVKTAIT